MYYLSRDPARHRRFNMALGLACAAHVALVLGVSFKAPDPPADRQQIEVTLSTRPSSERPDEARHKAAESQLGSGDEAPLESAATAATMPLLGAADNSIQPGTSLRRQSAAEAPVASRASSQHRVPRELLEEELAAAGLQGINPELDQLNREMAELQARLIEQNQAYADRPRVRRLTSVSALQAADAAYLQAWRERVEAVGNKYYPEASVRYGIYGSLRLLVVIQHDGNLENIHVLSSSGYDVLDEAAIKIVRLAAPFQPFPKDLRATTDRLEIIRTWQFRENRLSSG